MLKAGKRALRPDERASRGQAWTPQSKPMLAPSSPFFHNVHRNLMNVSDECTRKFMFETGHIAHAELKLHAAYSLLVD